MAQEWHSSSRAGPETPGPQTHGPGGAYREAAFASRLVRFLRPEASWGAACLPAVGGAAGCERLLPPPATVLAGMGGTGGAVCQPKLVSAGPLHRTEMAVATLTCRTGGAAAGIQKVGRP